MGRKPKRRSGVPHAAWKPTPINRDATRYRIVSPEISQAVERLLSEAIDSLSIEESSATPSVPRPVLSSPHRTIPLDNTTPSFILSSSSSAHQPSLFDNKSAPSFPLFHTSRPSMFDSRVITSSSQFGAPQQTRFGPDACARPPLFQGNGSYPFPFLNRHASQLQCVLQCFIVLFELSILTIKPLKNLRSSVLIHHLPM